MNRWGIDLGGTKIECAVLDENQQCRIRRRIPTEAAKGYEHIISRVQTLVNEVAAELGERPSRVGFATPGTLEPDTRLMKNCNTVSMNGRPMQDDLSAALEVPAILANDANCFALAETQMGIGREFPGAQVVFGIIMGTGVGGGLVVNRQIIAGHQGLGGEWGHNILEEDGAACYCGKRGCVEKVISGPALEAFYLEKSGHRLPLPEIVRRHMAGGDSHASATIGRLLDYFGRAVSVLINIVDPDLIIVGGGVGNIDLLYTEGYERIRDYVFNSGRLTTTLRKPMLGDSAGVFGAALL